MHCTNCGAQMPDTAKFCGACGSKSVTADSQTGGSQEINETVEQVKWYKRNDAQAKNLTYLIIGLANLFNPYATVGGISVTAMTDLIGIGMLLAIFAAMYMNYMKNYKPLIFVFGFLTLCSLLILISAAGVASTYPSLSIKYWVPIGLTVMFLLGTIVSYKESKK